MDIEAPETPALKLPVEPVVPAAPTLKRTRDVFSPTKAYKPVKQPATEATGLRGSVHFDHSAPVTTTLDEAEVLAPQKSTSSASKDTGALGHIQDALKSLQQALQLRPDLQEVVDLLKARATDPAAGQPVGQPTTTETRLEALERKLDILIGNQATAPQHPKSYAAAAAKSLPKGPKPPGTAPEAPKATKPTGAAKGPTKPQGARPSGENRLVLLLQEGAPTPDLDPLALRNALNSHLKTTKGLYNVVSTISLSLKGNITITTPKHKAIDLIDRAVVQEVFQDFPVKEILTPTT
jgi:hypothetical protein